MKRSKKGKKTNRKPELKERVERLVTFDQPQQTIDGIDEDILAHVNHFFSTPLPKLEKISLLTPEDARVALGVIERTKRILEERMRAVQILKTLCENAKKVENII